MQQWENLQYPDIRDKKACVQSGLVLGVHQETQQDKTRNYASTRVILVQRKVCVFQKRNMEKMGNWLLRNLLRFLTLPDVCFFIYFLFLKIRRS